MYVPRYSTDSPDLYTTFEKHTQHFAVVFHPIVSRHCERTQGNHRKTHDDFHKRRIVSSPLPIEDSPGLTTDLFSTSSTASCSTSWLNWHPISCYANIDTFPDFDADWRSHNASARAAESALEHLVAGLEGPSAKDVQSALKELMEKRSKDQKLLRRSTQIINARSG